MYISSIDTYIKEYLYLSLYINTCPDPLLFFFIGNPFSISRTRPAPLYSPTPAGHACTCMLVDPGDCFTSTGSAEVRSPGDRHTGGQQGTQSSGHNIDHNHN